MDCPLTGKPCNNTRSFKVIETVDGKKTQLHLCQQCAESFLATDKTSAEIRASIKPVAVSKPEKSTASQMLSGIINLFSKKNVNALAVETPEDSCPNCKIKISEISKLKRLGCMKCYEHFGDKVLPLLNKIHGATKHVGKIPKQFEEQKLKKKKPESIEQYIIDLNKLMQEAIKEENYEAAALHRDSIKLAKTMAEECIELTKELEKYIAEDNKEKAHETQKKLKSIIIKCLNKQHE